MAQLDLIGKHNRSRSSAGGRRALLSAIAQELDQCVDLIIDGIPLNSRLIIFKCALRAMASVKRKHIRRRHGFKRTPIPITP